MKFSQHLHDHSHITTVEHAALFKTGILDVPLLTRLGLQLTDSLTSCPVVAVEFVAMVWNGILKRNDPLYLVKDINGKVCGTYYAAAFESLVL